MRRVGAVFSTFAVWPFAVAFAARFACPCSRRSVRPIDSTAAAGAATSIAWPLPREVPTTPPAAPGRRPTRRRARSYPWARRPSADRPRSPSPRGASSPATLLLDGLLHTGLCLRPLAVPSGRGRCGFGLGYRRRECGHGRRPVPTTGRDGAADLTRAAPRLDNRARCRRRGVRLPDAERDGGHGARRDGRRAHDRRPLRHCPRRDRDRRGAAADRGGAACTCSATGLAAGTARASAIRGPPTTRSSSWRAGGDTATEVAATGRDGRRDLHAPAEEQPFQGP